MDVEVIKSNSSKRSYLILTLCFITFGAVIAILSSLINYELQYIHIDDKILAQFEQERLSKLETLNQSVGAQNLAVSALANNRLLQTYLRTRSPRDLQSVHSLFLAAAFANPTFVQIRFLDAKGKEQIRIERQKGGDYLVVVPEALLQDKSSRYYFLEARHHSKSQLWHSRLDLNIEHGELLWPLQPSFRVAKSVYNEELFSGIVIINVKASAMLHHLSVSPNFDVIIADGEGEILIHPDNALSWSRYQPERGNLYKLYPLAAPELLTNPNSRVGDMFSFSIEGYFKNGQKLQVIMRSKPEALSHLVQGYKLAALMIALIVLLISFPLSWLAAMIPARLQTQLRDALKTLKRTNKVVDRYVMFSRTDLKGRITHASSAFCKEVGYNLGELKGNSHHILHHPETPEAIIVELWLTIRSGQIWRGELRNVNKSGEEYWIDCVISPERNAEGKIIAYTQIAQDISDRKLLEVISVTDALTQVFNRRKLDQLLAKEMQRYKRYRHRFSVIMLDLDHFKRLNDSYGHQVGDDVLVQAAECLRTNIREVDFVGRWGGEEFLIVCSSTNAQGAMNLAEKLRMAIQSLAFTFPLQLTASFGVGQCREHEPLNQLIGRVDKALYDAKTQGRNRLVLASIEEGV